MVGYALTLGSAAGFVDLSKVIAARLTPLERAGLAYAAMRALGDGGAAMVADAVLGRDDLPPASEAMAQAAVEYRRARGRGARA